MRQHNHSKAMLQLFSVNRLLIAHTFDATCETTSVLCVHFCINVCMCLSGNHARTCNLQLKAINISILEMILRN